MGDLLKFVSLAFTYPENTEEYYRENLERFISKNLLGEETYRCMEENLEKLFHKDLMEAQADYVNLFDQKRSCSLYLLEHAYGESRDRGGALVALRELYHRYGYESVTDELPDYIPMYFELLSEIPEKEMIHRMEEIGGLLYNLWNSLTLHNVYYAGILEVVIKQFSLKRSLK